MAIKVSGTTVINDSRQLQNIATLDSTTAATISGAAGLPVIGLGTGGTVSTDGDYKVHKFTSSGTFTVTVAGQYEVLCIGGGGAGGDYIASGSKAGGGGGAGGFVNQYFNLSKINGSNTAYTCTVGTGGSGQVNSVRHLLTGIPSLFHGPEAYATAFGGGCGGNAYAYGPTGNGPGGDGSSGGGGGNDGNVGGGATVGQGTNGGSSNNDAGGGGGGMSVAGSNAPTGAIGGAGGAGKAYSITGSSVTYGGGGGGGGDVDGGGAGGAGGGGSGGYGNQSGAYATANTGGGGGGSGRYGGSYGRSGGSGIVIVRYKFQ